jgi:hypothetical protein
MGLKSVTQRRGCRRAFLDVPGASAAMFRG